jgi:phosphoglycolate phosphatase-like HAD superfamily hydrolase
LITFDVDGTLVKGSGQSAEASAHARAFSHAVSTVLSPLIGATATNDERTRPIVVPPVAQALPRELYHGSTDGLILMRLARATLGMEPDVSFPHLPDMMNVMYEYIRQLPDEEVARGISPLPGVLETLHTLTNHYKDDVICGLVTGNVEGIARIKMRAVGILATGALAPPCVTQLSSQSWPGSEHLGFLGGFGSDYCSGNIDDLTHNYLDRSRQIEIAAQRCRNSIRDHRLTRIVHVGDAPADVLAAKYFAQRCNNDTENMCVVGMVATATGSYPAELLQELAGTPIPGSWEPVVLSNGMADPANFLAACGIKK